MHISDLNETMRSKENYRIHNGAMNNYDSHMKAYADLLVEQHRQLLQAIESVNQVIS